MHGGRKPTLFSMILGLEKMWRSIFQIFWMKISCYCCHVIYSDTQPLEMMLQWSWCSHSRIRRAVRAWVRVLPALLIALCPDPRAVPGTWQAANTYCGMNEWMEGKAFLLGCGDSVKWHPWRVQHCCARTTSKYHQSDGGGRGHRGHRSHVQTLLFF